MPPANALAKPVRSIANPLEDWRPEPRLRAAAETQPPGFLDRPYPYADCLSVAAYEYQKRLLQIELLKMQAWLKDTRRRMVILFEGRDAAGKGGAIKRFTEHLNPRGARVVALDKPSEVERGQWYFQRYIEHLPTAGELVLFDRSWYNRSGVERVMGFCTEDEYHAFLRQVVDVEKNLVESGIILIKFWLCVSREEQARRFHKRANDPLKTWKLSEIDLASMRMYDDYSRAERDVFAHTATPANPWVVIKSDDKRRARINAMRFVLNAVDYDGRDPMNAPPEDPLLVEVVR